MPPGTLSVTAAAQCKKPEAKIASGRIISSFDIYCSKPDQCCELEPAKTVPEHTSPYHDSQFRRSHLLSGDQRYLEPSDTLSRSLEVYCSQAVIR
jgi:hypothetical protein